MNADSQVLPALFAMLLKGYSMRSARDERSAVPLASRIRVLLEAFNECRARSDRVERIQASDDCNNIKTVLAGYNENVEIYARRQAADAEDFNIFEVMQLTGKEVRHSMALAWLLDRDWRRFGTHAQGNLGLQLFLKEFKELALPPNYADVNYRVRREVASDESIVDVEIACRGHFIIHIENKNLVIGRDRSNRPRTARFETTRRGTRNW